MKIKREISQQESDKNLLFQAQVTFYDVAAYFSDEDWKILHEWQQELYKNVMKEIHQTLISLGYQIINSDTLVRINKRKEACTQDLQDAQRRADDHDPTSSHHPATSPDILLRIKREEDQYCRDQCGSEEAEIISPCKEHDSVIVKKEDTINFTEHQSPERRETISISTAFPCLNPDFPLPVEEESEKQLMDHDGEDSSTGPTFGDGTVDTNKKDVDSVQHTQESSCTSSLEKNKVMVLQDSENGAHSISQPWSDNKKELKGEDFTQCESDFGNTTLLNSQQGATVMETSVTYEFESNLRNSKLPTCEPSTQHNWRPYMCVVCEKSFHQKGHLIAHQRIHSGEKPYQCHECGKSFCQKNNLTRHQRTHTGGRKKNPNMKALTQKEITSQCTDYEKHFSYKERVIVQKRTRTQSRPYQSTKGDKSFSAINHFLPQMANHTVDIPYQSNDCQESFIQKGPCIAQQDTCTRGRPYQLDTCENSFSERRIRIQHCRSHALVKSFHCTECEKSFSQKGHLITHQRTHSGERPYQCTECEKSFCQKNNLTRHMRTHTREIPHQCTDCVKCYSDAQSLVVHQRTHTVDNTPHPV